MSTLERLAPADGEFVQLATGFGFVEAPRVLDDGSVVFSDLVAGGFYHAGLDGQTRALLAGRRWIGGSVVDADGSILLSGEGGIVRLDPATGTTRPVLNAIGGAPVAAVNDMEADDEGGVYGGTIDFPAILDRREQGRPGVLFRLSPDGEVEVIREGIAASNGIGFSPDRSIFYHSDCTVGVWAYDYARGGRPRNPVLFAKLDDSDGLAVDMEGGVWVARWKAAELVRFRPDGVIDRRIALPFPNVISLAFGGSDLCQMYVATGGIDSAGRRVGGIVRLRVDVPGQSDAVAMIRAGMGDPLEQMQGDPR